VNISQQSKHKIRVDVANRQVIDAIVPSLIGKIAAVSTGEDGLFFDVEWDFGYTHKGVPILSRELMLVPAEDFAEDFSAKQIVTLEVTRLFQVPT
jgi:hypothetical protein